MKIISDVIITIDVMAVWQGDHWGPLTCQSSGSDIPRDHLRGTASEKITARSFLNHDTQAVNSLQLVTHCYTLLHKKHTNAVKAFAHECATAPWTAMGNSAERASA